MIWNRLLLYLGTILALLLMLRLLTLRLHRVYRVFCGFLLFEILESVLAIVNALLGTAFDYRVVWLILSVPEWFLTLWMVYTLLDAILGRLPGILRFSRRLLNVVFLAGAAVAVISTKFELDSGRLSDLGSPVAHAVLVGLILQRVVATTALLVLLAILSFVLWFPVQMPRNLVLFSIGLVVYFSFRTCLLLAQYIAPAADRSLLLRASVIVLPACFAYWALSITAAGEGSAVRIGHRWSTSEQDRLVARLENMNAVLLRETRR